MTPNFSFYYNGKKYTRKDFTNDICVVDDTLTVTYKTSDYPEYNAFYGLLYFENPSDKNSGILSDINDFDSDCDLGEIPESKSGYRPEENNVFVESMNGMVSGSYYWENDKESAKEYQFSDIYLSNGVNRGFSNVCGRSSDGTMPFFNLKYKNRGLIHAIGWTGSWKANFLRKENIVNIKTGLQKAKFYLKGKEKLRTASNLIMEYSDGEDCYNKFRRLIKNHFSNAALTKNKRGSVMAPELWGGLSTDEMIKRIREFREYSIRFDDIWLDAGWYGNCKKCDEPFTGDWSEHTGEWEINKRIHPDELLEVKKEANKSGMRMMLWFEPERVVSNLEIAKNHPDWFIEAEGQPNKILWYGNETALEYVYNLISDYIKKLDLSVYRQDFNTNIKIFFDAHDEENRIGITEIKHITGMYRLWDRLLEKHPDLVIDNCASGGRRIDIESLSRSIPVFRSDYQCNFNANPEVIQVHNAGISHYLPYNGCSTKVKGDTYTVRSSYSSSFCAAYYNAIFQSMTKEDFLWAKGVSDEYLKIRHYFTMDFYNHGSRVFDDTSWAIWQYHDYESGKGIVMVFRRKNSAMSCADIELKGLSDGAEFKFVSFDSASFEVNGINLKIYLPQKRSSTIIEYSPIAITRI